MQNRQQQHGHDNEKRKHKLGSARPQEQRQFEHDPVADHNQAESVDQYRQDNKRQAPCPVVRPSFLSGESKHSRTTWRLEPARKPGTALIQNESRSG